MQEPRDLVEKLEARGQVSSGNEHRFAGYAVMGLPFASGHVLGLRRFPESSLGPSYTSVWHRSPDGGWRIFQDVPREQVSSHHFGTGVADAVIRDIRIEWSADREFTVSVDDNHPLYWSLALSNVPETRFIHALGGMTPGALWRQPMFMKLMGGVASIALGAGHMGLMGQESRVQRFVANPRLVWTVSGSTATFDGESVGDVGALPVQTGRGNFWIPQQGVFVIGSAFLETVGRPGTTSFDRPPIL